MSNPYIPVIFSRTNDLIDNWRRLGGGVMIRGSSMGCGLNVMSFLGYIQRDSLVDLITTQERNERVRSDWDDDLEGMSISTPIGMSLYNMAELINVDLTTSVGQAVEYQIFTSLWESLETKEDRIDELLNYIQYNLIHSASQYPFKFLIIKMILNKDNNFGHTIIIAYNSILRQMVTFDPQRDSIGSGRNTLRQFSDFKGYLMGSTNFVGVSLILVKPQATPATTRGGKQKTKRNKSRKGKRKTKRHTTSGRRKNSGGSGTSKINKNFIWNFVNNDKMNYNDENMLKQELENLDKWYES